jgi:NAD(P)-dependent dehydrogenase (short-subunit alcohol dehydrogenase family)
VSDNIQRPSPRGLAGRVGVITGAARGVGRATAIRLARRGCDLALIDIGKNIEGLQYSTGSRRQLDRTADLCREAGATTLTIIADVRSREELESAARSIIARFGAIEILVNAAGIAAPSGKVAHAVTDAEWNLVFEINLTGQWRTISVILPFMLEKGAGAIINVASTAGLVGYARCAAYVASKHGLVGLTRALALECAQGGVRVNAVCPGWIADEEVYEGRMLTGMGASLGMNSRETHSFFQAGQPASRLVSPDSVASAIEWLAGDDAMDVTGSVITVDGAYTTR